MQLQYLVGPSLTCNPKHVMTAHPLKHQWHILNPKPRLEGECINLSKLPYFGHCFHSVTVYDRGHIKCCMRMYVYTYIHMHVLILYALSSCYHNAFFYARNLLPWGRVSNCGRVTPQPPPCLTPSAEPPEQDNKL